MQDPDMKCPDCGADVDPEQDFCLDCGEPIAGVKSAGSPKPASAAKPMAAAPSPAAVPKPATGASVPSSGEPDWRRTTLPATGAAKAKAKSRRVEEPEPVRCPGCGMKTLAERCPSCGTRLKPSED